MARENWSALGKATRLPNCMEGYHEAEAEETVAGAHPALGTGEPETQEVPTSERVYAAVRRPPLPHAEAAVVAVSVPDVDNDNDTLR